MPAPLPGAPRSPHQPAAAASRLSHPATPRRTALRPPRPSPRLVTHMISPHLQAGRLVALLLQLALPLQARHEPQVLQILHHRHPGVGLRGGGRSRGGQRAHNQPMQGAGPPGVGATQQQRHTTGARTQIAHCCLQTPLGPRPRAPSNISPRRSPCSAAPRRRCPSPQCCRRRQTRPPQSRPTPGSGPRRAAAAAAWGQAPAHRPARRRPLPL